MKVLTKAYSGLLRHIQNLHIQNLTIFQAAACLEPEAYSKPCETLNRHNQNPVRARKIYSGIFQQIQIYSKPCVTLVYAES